MTHTGSGRSLAFGLALICATGSAAHARQDETIEAPDARALLLASSEAARGFVHARYLADLELRVPGGAEPLRASAVEVELGPRLRRTSGPFLRPFRIEGRWAHATDDEPFSIAYDGRTLRHALHAKRQFVEEHLGTNEVSTLELSYWALLLPGALDEELLRAGASDEVSSAHAEVVCDRECDSVTLRCFSLPDGDGETRRAIAWERRFALASDDRLPRRWTTEVYAAQAGAALRADTRVRDLVLAERADARRFTLRAPEGYASRCVGKPKSELEVGDLAPLWTLRDSNGREHELAALRNEGRIVVLEFWTTTCAPCRRVMAELERLQERHGARGVSFLGINFNETGDVAAVLRKVGVSYPTLVEGDAVARDYGVLGAPQVFVIDVDGTVAFRARGVPDDLAQNLERVLDRLAGL